LTTLQRKLTGIAVLTGVYFIAGKLGLLLAVVQPNATAVWPCAGIALAAFLILGYDVWPAILLGAFLVNQTTAGSVATSIAIALGNTTEGLVGAYLVNRFAGGRRALDRTQNVFKFTFLGALLSTTIGATCGVTSLAIAGFAHWENYRTIWATWWLGDAVGDIVIAPVLLLWWPGFRVRWRRAKIAEAGLLLACLAVMSQVVFGGSVAGMRNYPLEYACIPVLMWAAFRFGQREAATATLLLAGTAVGGTLLGYGPFVREARNESLLLLQTFIGVVGVMTMTLAAAFAERQRAEVQARYLAVSDPMTGLGNYRKIIDTLDAEIRRSDRTGRSFALLLLDLDGLKKINDTYGHLTGDRAICRLANVLKVHCRATDTAGRYGGDEFALIIPETGPQTASSAPLDVAHQVARRIADRLAADGERPALSVSIGAAICPADGQTTESLLNGADRVLYEMKARSRQKAPAFLHAPRRHSNP
jgi:diguanylate cyclase (GGDEF)-like protein